MVPVKKTLLLFSICWLFWGTFTAYAQDPEIEITRISKTSGSFGEIVEITGYGFGTSTANLAVYFGAVTANISSIQDQFLQVTVPAGTTYAPISVTNTVTGNTAYSDENFLLSFGGDNGIETSDFEPPIELDNLFIDSENADNGLNDFCICDFNDDRLADIATASLGDHATTHYTFNNTNPDVGDFVFGKSSPGFGDAANITCGDVDGDGFNDLVISKDDSNELTVVLIGRTGNIIDFKDITISNNDASARRSIIHDIDNDGKPEIITSAQGGNSVIIFPNRSSGPGVIDFADGTEAAEVVFDGIEASKGTLGLQVVDLNQDGKPDIITNESSSQNFIFIATNTSTPGNIQFGDITTIGDGSTYYNHVRAGDFDGDGKVDIAASVLLLSSNISVFQNTTSTAGGQPSFASATAVLSVAGTFGLDIGDLDGDGLPDIALGSISDETRVSIINNRSTPGNMAFATGVTFPVNYANSNIKIGDLNGDAKPEIIIASIDDDEPVDIDASVISIVENVACLVPKITPEGAETLCESAIPLTLEVNEANDVIYEWFLDDGSGVKSIKNSGEAFLDITDVTATGTYTVTATSTDGRCVSGSSNSYELDIIAGTGEINVTAEGNNNPICEGDAFSLSASPTISGATYNWTGPGGLLGTDRVIELGTFNNGMVGKYEVELVTNGCVAGTASTIIESNGTVSANISTNFGGNSPTICDGNEVELSVPSSATGVTWFIKGIEETSLKDETTIKARVQGEYTAEIKTAQCGTVSSTNSVDVTVVEAPVAEFDIQELACVGQTIAFEASDIGGVDATPVYTWSFGDGNTSNEENPAHEYASAKTYEVSLVISYAEDSDCASNEAIDYITIENPPEITIYNPDGEDGICPGGTYALAVSETFDSYTWSNGATGQSTTVNEPGVHSVEISVNDGCLASSSVTVNELPAPVVGVAADPTAINIGDTTQLTATGLFDYSWSPAEYILDDPGINTPLATPVVDTYFIVSGTGENGCIGTDSVLVTVDGTILGRLFPMNFFSPNGDSDNELWKVSGIESFECSVNVYDQNGVQVYQSSPYRNDWDGNSNGKDLPPGVYYYIIGCEGESGKKTGSITLIR